MTEPPFGESLDREREIGITGKARPHWMQAGTIAFITMRLADSIPREVIRRWNQMRIDYLADKGIRCSDWKTGREQLEEVDRTDFARRFNRLREQELDTCHGACLLRSPAAADILSETLMFFDGERYVMGDFVILPNHVHLLVAFYDDTNLRKQCASWMRYSAREINRLVGRVGALWQEEPFDHLVRSEDQLEYLRRYIAENPRKARLPEGQYLYRRSEHHF